jgi:hypothetical protein
VLRYRVQDKELNNVIASCYSEQDANEALKYYELLYDAKDKLEIVTVQVKHDNRW